MGIIEVIKMPFCLLGQTSKNDKSLVFTHHAHRAGLLGQVSLLTNRKVTILVKWWSYFEGIQLLTILVCLLFCELADAPLYNAQPINFH